MADLSEDRDERRMFNEACAQYGGNPLRQMAGALTIWHQMAPKQGSYGKTLAIYANECAKAADEREELLSILRGCADAFEAIGNCPPVYTRILAALSKATE